MNETKTVSIKEILSDLENGLSRIEIKQKYNLVGREMQVLFNHPKLKNKKARKKVCLIINDDVEEVVSSQNQTNNAGARVENPFIILEDDENLESIAVEENAGEIAEGEIQDDENTNPFS